MKKLLLPVLAAACVLHAGDVPLTGKWQVHSSVAGNDNDQSCLFTQKDNALSGTCTGADNAKVEITGKVDGKKVSWSYKSAYNGTPLTVQFEGTIDASNQIKGGLSFRSFQLRVISRRRSRSRSGI